MNKITKKGILATQVLENLKYGLKEDEVQEVLEEIKPSRMKTRKQHNKEHEERKRRRFDDYDD